ncbi:hypothetical protein MVEN_00093800 [Mycena venus]|uniref:Uncharacterized protein n=1 Tax=Mycena venus TaxID=2733690 RepID=A0A8H6Z9R0_9AGAR|nr:hypothetical protein MVEN_00093800 [Mycena venus]
MQEPHVPDAVLCSWELVAFSDYTHKVARGREDPRLHHGHLLEDHCVPWVSDAGYIGGSVETATPKSAATVFHISDIWAQDLALSTLALMRGAPACVPRGGGATD